MEPDDKLMKNVYNWRVIYRLFSGLLFLALGMIIFIRAKGYMNFFMAGFFGAVLAAYGIYRIIFFIKFFKKIKETNK